MQSMSPHSWLSLIASATTGSTPCHSTANSANSAVSVWQQVTSLNAVHDSPQPTQPSVRQKVPPQHVDCAANCASIRTASAITDLKHSKHCASQYSSLHLVNILIRFRSFLCQHLSISFSNLPCPLSAKIKVKSLIIFWVIMTEWQRRRWLRLFDIHFCWSSYYTI